MFGAIFDMLASGIALDGRSGVQHAGFDATGAQASPMCLSQAQNERVLNGAGRLERFAKAFEDFVVLVLVLFGKDYESRSGQAMFQTIEPAALPAFIGFGSAEPPVATVGGDLTF
jgi:hypothetical protein